MHFGGNRSVCNASFGQQVELAQHAMQQAPTTMVQTVVEKTQEEITTEFVSEVSETTEEQRVQVYYTCHGHKSRGSTADFKHIASIVLNLVSLKYAVLTLD